MPEVLGEIAGVIVAILALAAATAATVYLLVLAPHQPLFVVPSILLYAVFLLLIYYGLMKALPVQLPQRGTVPATAPAQAVSVPSPATGALETTYYVARLETRDGRIIPIVSVRQTFGRSDFEKLVDPALARTISREHFTVYYDFKAGKFFIEDRGSTNGTYVNGVDIRGRGPIELKEGDVVSPAGVLPLIFRVGG